MAEHSVLSRKPKNGGANEISPLSATVKHEPLLLLLQLRDRVPNSER